MDKIPAIQQTRQATVEGTMLAYRPGAKFVGTIKFELRSDCIWYEWRMQSDTGEYMGSASRSVSLRVVPEGDDPFEYALEHATENIRRSRTDRRSAYEVTKSEWISPHPTS